MTELMKQYEGERVERDVIKYFEDMSPKQQVVKAFYVQCLFQEFKKLEAINKWLEAQLTWRQVSEKPEKDELIVLKYANGHIPSVLLYGGSTPWESIVELYGISGWLPIPPAPEGEVK